MNFNKKRTKFYCGKLHVTSPVRAGSSPWNGCAKRREEQEPGKRLGEGGGTPRQHTGPCVVWFRAPLNVFRVRANMAWCTAWRAVALVLVLALVATDGAAQGARVRARACIRGAACRALTVRGHASEAPHAARSPCARVCVCSHPCRHIRTRRARRRALPRARRARRRRREERSRAAVGGLIHEQTWRVGHCAALARGPVKQTVAARRPPCRGPCLPLPRRPSP
jgi:hypothetical protein